MSITYELSNFPGKNQLTEPISDGQPDGDRSYECVPTSIASGLQFLTGRAYDGDQVRDAVYGPNYVGGTAPSAYVAYCRAQGVDLVPFNGSQAALVSEIHSQLHQGHPVVITIPSQWGTPPPDPVHPVGWTHVGIMYGDGPGELELMNPWIWPQQHIGDDAYWAARLCFGQVWVMSKIGVPQPVSIILEKDSAGNVTGAHDASQPGIHIGEGLAVAAQAANLLGEDITLGEQPGSANGQPAALCTLGHRYVGGYGKASGVSRFVDFFEAAQQVEALCAAKASLQQQLVAAQTAGQQAQQQAQAAQAAQAADDAQVQKLTSQVNAAAQQLSDADAQIATLQQQLAAAQAQPPADPVAEKLASDVEQLVADADAANANKPKA